MKKIFAAVFIFNIWILNIFGQTCDCPGKISIAGPNGVVKAGEKIVFTVKVEPDKDNQSSYNWTVDKGTIISGQGTKSITVETVMEMAGQTISATVKISSDFWCPACDLTASETAIIENMPEPQLIDKFTRGNCEDVLARMDNFFNELNNYPMDGGYFIAYGKPRIVYTATREARNWLKIRRFDSSRITIISGGGDSERAEVEMWRVPPGANPPELKSLPETVAQQPGTAAAKPTKPYIFSREYSDGIAGCEPTLDLEGYARMLKENPKSRGNIVIMNLSKTEFRQEERRILQFLTKQRIARKRLRTFHQKVFGGVELWFLP